MNLQEINQMYNQSNKDMPRHEFVKRVQELTSPTRAQRDLGIIMGMKQTRAIKEAEERAKIDRAMGNNLR